MQAYANILAASLAGREDWFASPADEVMMQWSLWQGFVDAAEAVPFTTR
jgi:glucose-6-phosphate 1-dehydrogenase